MHAPILGELAGLEAEAGKFADGRIRRVTMDYGEIDRQKGASQDKLISELSLDLYEATEGELAEALASLHDGHVLLDLIANGVPRPPGATSDDESGAPKSELQRPTRDNPTPPLYSFSFDAKSSTRGTRPSSTS